MSTEELDLPPFLRPKTGDAKGYQERPKPAPKPNTDPPMNATFELIPLTVEAKGEIAISANIDEVREMVREHLANINRSPSTDEEFGQAELDIKALKGAEDRFQKASEDVLSKAASVNDVRKLLDETCEWVRAARLDLEKAVAKRKDEVKNELIEAALEKLDCAPRLRQSVYGKSVAEAIKGKRTVESMKKALDVIVTIHNGTIAKNRKAIEAWAAEHGLVQDAEDLETKSPDSVEGELRRRVEAKKAAEEKARLQREAAAAKAEADKLKAEAEAAKQPAAGTYQKPANVVELPQPPKSGAMLTGSSPDAEWQAFKAACRSAFAAVKAAREALRDPENQRRAGVLADSVNAGWTAMNAKQEEVAK